MPRVSSLEYLPHSNFQKRIVSAETIHGNTVFKPNKDVCKKIESSVDLHIAIHGYVTGGF